MRNGEFGAVKVKVGMSKKLGFCCLEYVCSQTKKKAGMRARDKRL